MITLLKLEEPLLAFHFNQTTADPRDGITLFGPLDQQKVLGIRAAVIGTRDGIRRFTTWAQQMQGPIPPGANPEARPLFPGFAAAFRTPWSSTPTLTREIPAEKISAAVHLDDKHQRVHEAVELFTAPIIETLRNEELRPDFWFVIEPDEVYKYCRPQSTVEAATRIPGSRLVSPRAGKRAGQEPFLFDALTRAARPYQFEPHFHNQLKARLLEHRIPTQLIRESTIAANDFLNTAGKPTRDLRAVVSDIAWNLATASYYKAGGRPWKLAGIRDGVCYIGIVFKQDNRGDDARSACCAAQMFLDSGDGVVFKGAIGPWYSPQRGDFHLTKAAARELLGIAMESYRANHGALPAEVFVHGKTRFTQEEWDGFRDAIPAPTIATGIRIGHTDLRLYRQARTPILRTLAYQESERVAYLWTKGFIPRLRTYPGREVPRPLRIEIVHGSTPMRTVLQDILALTKLNYNSCKFADGTPVTLRFADSVGEILTAGPTTADAPLPFKYYI